MVANMTISPVWSSRVRSPVKWALGRTEDGYELGLPASVTSFDLTRAFEKIPRNRLAALWQDPQTGRLRFSLACACHAFAFEFRPDIVVIDIRSGPAPAESAFRSAPCTSRCRNRTCRHDSNARIRL